MLYAEPIVGKLGCCNENVAIGLLRCFQMLQCSSNVTGDTHAAHWLNLSCVEKLSLQQNQQLWTTFQEQFLVRASGLCGSNCPTVTFSLSVFVMKTVENALSWKGWIEFSWMDCKRIEKLKSVENSSIWLETCTQSFLRVTWIWIVSEWISSIGLSWIQLSQVEKGFVEISWNACNHSLSWISRTSNATEQHAPQMLQRPDRTGGESGLVPCCTKPGPKLARWKRWLLSICAGELPLSKKWYSERVDQAKKWVTETWILLDSRNYERPRQITTWSPD